MYNEVDVQTIGMIYLGAGLISLLLVFYLFSLLRRIVKRLTEIKELLEASRFTTEK